MRLAAFISSHREEILEEWERRATSRAPRDSKMNFAPLRDHLGVLLDAIARDLDVSTRDAPIADENAKHNAWKNVEEVAEKHGAGRVLEGITLKQMVPEFPALRSCVTTLWLRSEPKTSSRDIEELVRFDEALDHALMHSVTEFMDKLNRSRETFLSILSHDLRNPLSTIIMAAKMMLEKDFDPMKAREMAERIVSTGERMHQLVVDLVDFARTRGSGQMPIERRECDLGETVRSVADEFKTSHPRRPVTVETHGDLRGAWDDERMSQAVGNLLGNAMHHGSPDTPISISTSGDEREVAISVHNEGPPIKPEMRERLFDPLIGAEARGTSGSDSKHLGLGLYIAKAIVAGHQGDIDVESSPERGTTFTIHLPRVTDVTEPNDTNPR